MGTRDTERGRETAISQSLFKGCGQSQRSSFSESAQGVSPGDESGPRRWPPALRSCSGCDAELVAAGWRSGQVASR